jgi:hypothetical protein
MPAYHPRPLLHAPPWRVREEAELIRSELLRFARQRRERRRFGRCPTRALAIRREQSHSSMVSACYERPSPRRKVMKQGALVFVTVAAFSLLAACSAPLPSPATPQSGRYQVVHASPAGYVVRLDTQTGHMAAFFIAPPNWCRTSSSGLPAGTLTSSSLSLLASRREPRDDRRHLRAQVDRAERLR